MRIIANIILHKCPSDKSFVKIRRKIRRKWRKSNKSRDIDSDAELSEIVADIRSRGMTPHLFVGEARLKNGGIADAMIRNGDVYIRVDSPEWTATQNWEHEKFHGILGKSREMIRDLWQQMKIS